MHQICKQQSSLTFRFLILQILWPNTFHHVLSIWSKCLLQHFRSSHFLWIIVLLSLHLVHEASFLDKLKAERDFAGIQNKRCAQFSLYSYDDVNNAQKWRRLLALDITAFRHIYPLHDWPPTSDILGNKALYVRIYFLNDICSFILVWCVPCFYRTALKGNGFIYAVL